ncbi:hypothetical protein PPGU19_085510 (plasmid) [Paraburkholderia sp. PGU19]|uniref:hypothetical protein n=1 Tax=Paraburkholderia sp. PGU19 TaxID=2735434 RepID=UPI0015DBBC23|nr:hypothetical protein [Paraburkholderia sp. PGU19]BCG03983.1 hypothetical protein PPGU19_085510 [Paraburkholderia sp. PGU19]
MFDAEIAATLLNRWDSKGAHPEYRSPLDLLQEGRLHFKRDAGDIQARDFATDGCLRIECLTFADGSRALRVADAKEQNAWSRWTAAEPA